MNNEIQKAFEYALLARAAYADLTTADNGTALASTLKTLQVNPVPAAMATYISDHYQVIASKTDAISGYDGVLFRNIKTGEYILANRGTQKLGTSGFWDTAGDVVADLSLALTGLNVQAFQMDSFIDDIKQHYLPPNTKMTLAGHSLGGFLNASAINRGDATSLFSEAYNYNPAGLGNLLLIPSLINQVMDFFGSTPLTYSSPVPQHNYRNAEGVYGAAATGFYGSAPVGINVDDDPPHAMPTLNDVLAVYNLLGTVDSSVTIETLNAIHEASSQKGTTDNDVLVKAFGTLVNKALNFGLDGEIAAVGSDNEKMHDAIFAILKKLDPPQSLDITSLVDALGNTSDIAYRYALRELNAFMAGGVSYDNFNQSKELDLYDAETGEGSLTEKWLESRGQMLKEVLKANTNNTSISTHSGKGNYSYQDFMSSSTSISLTSNSTEPLNNSDSPLAEATHKITFAGSTGQNFSGSMESDSLFGGSGADNIDGLGGDDYLEGGQGDDLVDGGADKDTLWGMAGNDILRGNTGDDTLVGGIGKDQLEGGADSDWLQGDKGNDTLEGGKGCDWLEGGADNDTYLFFAGDGNDTIVDTEGENLLKVKGDSNIIATRKGDYVGVYEDEKKTYLLKTEGHYGSSLMEIMAA